jgi:paraquat-inducible protein A
MAPLENILSCPVCGLAQRVEAARPGAAFECVRCGAYLGREPERDSLHLTGALTLAALVLFAPANLYPILRMYWSGAYSESTVWDGVVSLAQSNQWFVATIVFLASIVIPLVKLISLFYLVVSAQLRSRALQHFRTRLWRFVDVIGPWAMLDVFLLAVLVALVKLGTLATVLPGPGLTAFCAVVVLTILASATFDPRLIWMTQKGRTPQRGTTPRQGATTRQGRPTSPKPA